MKNNFAQVNDWRTGNDRAGVSMAQADGTAQLDLTVEANITAGTCAASVVDGETATNTIAFGNVYISEVLQKQK